MSKEIGHKRRKMLKYEGNYLVDPKTNGIPGPTPGPREIERTTDTHGPQIIPLFLFVPIINHIILLSR